MADDVSLDQGFGSGGWGIWPPMAWPPAIWPPSPRDAGKPGLIAGKAGLTLVTGGATVLAGPRSGRFPMPAMTGETARRPNAGLTA